MNLIVDAEIYQRQQFGGISRLFTEVLPRMCDLDENLHIRFLIDDRLKQSLPQHSKISHQFLPPISLPMRPQKRWAAVRPKVRRLMWRILIGTGEGKIWHSTYYTRPEKWKGKQVVTIHDMNHEFFPHLFDSSLDQMIRKRKKECIERADALICVSETTKNDVEYFYGMPPNRIEVIPHGVSQVFNTPIKEQQTLRMSKPFLLYVGRRTHNKNFDTLVRAYSSWTRHKDIELAVVGQSWNNAEKQLLKELGLQHSVNLLVGLKDETLSVLYTQALAFIYPSLYEGFGIPLLEAMAAGCPIVASRIPSTIEVAGECPIYFDPLDADDLLLALETVASEGRESERTKLGLERVKLFSWEKAAKKTLKLYKTL
jgi:glycosyltransferase involved in cell wall biosynthesis